MPPKADPYATKSARAVDVLLILLAIAAILLVILTAPRHRHNIGAAVRAVPNRTLAAAER